MVTITGTKTPLVGDIANYAYTGQETTLKWAVIGGSIISRGNKFIQVKWNRIGTGRVDVYAGSTKTCLPIKVGYTLKATNPICTCTITLGALTKVNDSTYQVVITTYPAQQQVSWKLANTTTQYTGIAQVINGRISIPVSGLAIGNYTLTIQGITCTCSVIASDHIIITTPTVTPPTVCTSLVDLTITGQEITFWSCADSATVTYPSDDTTNPETPVTQFKVASLTGNSQYINPQLALVGDQVSITNAIPTTGSFYWINGLGPYSVIPDEALLSVGDEVVIYKATNNDPNPYTGIFTNRGFTQVLLTHVA